MQRSMVLVSVLLLLSMACTWSVQTFAPTAQIPTQSPPQMQTETSVPAHGQVLEGPDINYNSIRFYLDPSLASRLYVFEDVISLDGATAHYTRFGLTQEEYCQTWCLMVYPVPEFEKAFGTFVFPPDGYRGGAAIIFEARKTTLSLQNGSGDRSLETFGQSHYGVSNESLKYVFRGYSADKQYGIYVQVPIRTTSLPDVAPTMDFNSQDVFDYNQRAAETINALTKADFAPDLDLLDALVTSIQVDAP